MNNRWILLYFLFFANLAKGQLCESIYNSSTRLFKTGNYNLAIKKLAAYKICAPDKTLKADSLLIIIYKTVNKQRIEAIAQRNIATKRATTIKIQRDSIEKEYFASRAATRALQENALDPTKAMQYVNAGLCLSPGNLSLLEIRKGLLANEVLRKNLDGSSNSNTLCVEKLNNALIITGDAEGKIKLWSTESKTLVKEKKLYEGAISGICVLSEKDVLLIGNESKDYRHPCYKLKLLDTKTTVTSSIDSCFTSSMYAAKMGIDNTVLIATEKGDFYKYNPEKNTIMYFKKSTNKIIGLRGWEQEGKIFYATPNAVYDFQTNAELYKAPQESFISYLGSCARTNDIYIGIGSNIILYNYTKSTRQLLFPIHSGVVTSCNCASEEGTFLSTGLDGLAVLWTSNGNIGKVLKGSRAELYNGYLSPDENYAITVGRRELTSSIQADTNTTKYWYLKDFLRKMVREAHFMGANAAIYVKKLQFFITAGTDGKIIIWNKDLVYIDSKKVNGSGISSLSWSEEDNTLVYGTFSGEVGKINLNNKGLLSTGRIRKLLPSGNTLVLVLNGEIYVGGKSKFMYCLHDDNSLDSIQINSTIFSIHSTKDKKNILLSTANKVTLYNIAHHTKKDYMHQVEVKSADWISDNQFVSISGQYMQVWEINNNHTPLIKIDNAIRNTMTSLFVDRVNKYIYTGTWNGYMFCYDFNGKFLYELHKMPSHILSITTDYTSKILSVDYNGNVAQFSNPNIFQNIELNLEYDCTKLMKYFNYR